MKKIVLAVLSTATFVACSCANASPKKGIAEELTPPGRGWSVERAWEWYRSIRPTCGCNYLPRTAVNATEMWQADTFDPATIDQELGWAANAGYNSVRVFLQYLVWKDDAVGLKKRINEFLTIADKHGITTTLIFFCDCSFAGKEPYLGKQDDPVPGVHNSGWVPSPGLKRVTDRAVWPDLEKYVKDITATFARDKRVLIWDLYNEPGNSRMGEKSLPLLAATFAWAREANPSQPVTTGVWTGFGNRMSKRIIELSDIITFHSYGKPDSVLAAIGTCKKAGRPLVCTECLRRQVGNTFSSILPLFAKHEVGWYNWGLVAGRTQTYMSWGSKKGDPMPKIWQHDMFHPDGTPYDPKELHLIRAFTFDRQARPKNTSTDWSAIKSPSIRDRSHKAPESAFTVEQLSCEYAANPLGVDARRPRFTWVLKSSRRGQMQSGYQVLVASSEGKLNADIGDKWDSGKVLSERSVNISYEGSPLSSGEKCYWKVRCWDREGKASRFSERAAFEMGLLRQDDWRGQWIGRAAAGSIDYAPGKLRRALHLDGESQSVRIPHYAKLKPAAAITISAWIKPTQCTEAWREIYRKEDGLARQLLAIGETSDIYGLWVGLGIAGSYTERGAPLAASQLKDGEWRLVAATYDGHSIRFYADGKQIGSAPATGPLNTAGSNPAYVGSLNGASEFFAGGIDDVRVYNRALPPAEIEALAAGRQGDLRGLVGWWKFDGNLANSAGGPDGEAVSNPSAPSPLLRTEFTLEKEVEQARAYFSGLGWSELFINGRKVGDHVLDPAATDYDKRVLYETYDVTELLRHGPNAVGVMLGNGWFSEPPRPGYGDSPRLLLQMNIQFADGSRKSVTSEATWKASSGPITRNDIYGGESYDARLEKPGWTTPGYDDSSWEPAVIKRSPGGKLVSQLMPPIKVNKTIEPVRLTNPRPGIYVYDMGQLFGGWARLHIKGPRGTKVTIKYSARLHKDSGLLDNSRYGRGNETDYYILKGDPEGEVYEPRFTYHPVRYVQIEGYPGRPTSEDLRGRVVYSAVDLSGDFHCCNPLLNAIHRNVAWTFTNGLYGFPLDCLHREHWGWLDPATVASTLYARKYMPLFWTKWLDDARCAQHENGVVPDVVPAYPLKGRSTGDPAWATNYLLLVWYLHQYYGDYRILRQHYPAMKRWIDHLTSIAEDHLITKGYYGDHMLPGDAPGKEQFISKETPPSLVWTGYYYRGVFILSHVAELLDKPDDARQYRRLAEDIENAFNKNWLNRETNQYAGGSQTANVFPLALGIVPEANRESVLGNIVRDIVEKRGGHLHTGNTGTTCVIDTLTEQGRGDVMYKVATATTYPGWGYMVEQGATTIWENWGLSGDAESMIMWASIDEFFYNDLAGIRGPDYYGHRYMTPGFRRVRIQPHPLGDLTGAAAAIRTVRGRIAVAWQRDRSSLTMKVTIPVNSKATVSVPKAGLANVLVKESGNIVWRKRSFVGGVAGITAGEETDDYVNFEVGSGEYTFCLTGQK